MAQKPTFDYDIIVIGSGAGVVRQQLSLPGLVNASRL